MMLFALTVVVGVLTVVPGRAIRLQGGVHLILLAAFRVPRDQPMTGGMRQLRRGRLLAELTGCH